MRKKPTQYEMGLGANEAVPLFKQLVAAGNGVSTEGTSIEHVTLPCWGFHQSTSRSASDLWNYCFLSKSLTE